MAMPLCVWLWDCESSIYEATENGKHSNSVFECS